MSYNFEQTTLGSIADILMGQSPPGETCNQKGLGIPLLNGPSEFGSYHPTPIQFTTDSRKLAKKNDLLFCVRGSTTGRMNWADQNYSIGRGLAALRHIRGLEYQPYLKALLETLLPDLLGSATGSTFPNVSRDQLAKAKIFLHSPDQQLAISRILNSLDSKIELNRQMCKTLEDLTSTLFKSWFIDFDPVKAKAAGREPEGLNPEIADLFPDSFVDSPLGKIPKGWKKKQLGEIITLKYGKALNAKDRSYGQIPVYGSSGIIGYHNQAIIKGPSIIVGRKGNVGTIYWTQSDCFPIDTVYYIDSSGTNRYLYHSLKNLIFHNNDSAVPGLNRDYAHRQILIYPQETIIHQFENTTKDLFNQPIHIENYNQKLTQTRDLLLPKLINGEVKIQEAELLISASI